MDLTYKDKWNSKNKFGKKSYSHTQTLENLQFMLFCLNNSQCCFFFYLNLFILFAIYFFYIVLGYFKDNISDCFLWSAHFCDL